MKISLTALLLSCLINFSTYAASVKQKDLNFPVKGEELLKGDIHYSVEVLSREDLEKLVPDFTDLDTSGFSRSRNTALLVNKTAYVVNRPVGFFDHEKSTNEVFLKHLFGEQKLKKTGDNTFLVTIPGNQTQTYKMKIHFDSDDISTTTDSRAIRAMTAAKKMDIQVQGASSLFMRETWDYSRGALGSVHVTAFITLKEDRTLVIDYGIFALIPPLLARETLEDSITVEAEAHQNLINRFKQD